MEEAEIDPRDVMVHPFAVYNVESGQADWTGSMDPGSYKRMSSIISITLINHHGNHVAPISLSNCKREYIGRYEGVMSG